MQRKDFSVMTCPIARALDRVGEWWSILILRDAFAGMTRFDEFQKSLGIAPNILTSRLNGLVESGMLERHQYNAHPPRSEYRLTPKGEDFRSVLVALFAWGNRHFMPDGATMQIADTQTGQIADPIMVDRATLRPLTAPEFTMIPGPAADANTLRRLAIPGRQGLLPTNQVTPL